MKKQTNFGALVNLKGTRCKNFHVMAPSSEYCTRTPPPGWVGGLHEPVSEWRPIRIVNWTNLKMFTSRNESRWLSEQFGVNCGPVTLTQKKMKSSDASGYKG